MSFIRKYSPVFYAMIILVFSGCSSSRKMSYEELMETAPGWVRQTPNNPIYYHGVGLASKALVPDFREKARQTALSELSGGISVNISSTSVLNQFDYNDNSSQFFRDNIKLASQQYLEGYEMVEEWETEQQYWVYYRLSKQKYAEVKQQRINSALNLSLSKYGEAASATSRGRAFEAIGLYIKSVEDIRNFLGEDLRAEINGTEKVYATELVAGLSRQLQSVRFDFGTEMLTIRPGTGSKFELRIRVIDENGLPVSGMPVRYSYSWLPGNSFNAISDVNGFFSVIVDRLKANAPFPKISCQVDMPAITRSNTNDVMVQRLFSEMKTDVWVLPVEVIAPSVYLSVDTRLGRAVSTKVIDEYSRLLRNDGIHVTRDSIQANYVLKTIIDDAEPVKVGNSYSVNLKVSFEVHDPALESILYMQSNDCSGLATTASGSIDNALQSMLSLIRISVYPFISEHF